MRRLVAHLGNGCLDQLLLLLGQLLSLLGRQLVESLLLLLLLVRRLRRRQPLDLGDVRVVSQRLQRADDVLRRQCLLAPVGALLECLRRDHVDEL